MQTWLAIDCETTGLLPGARLLELGAVLFREDGSVTAEFQRLVRPPVSVPPFITELTGISADSIANAPSAKVVLAEFTAWMPSGVTLVGHNIAFDLAVLQAEQAPLIHNEFLCVDTLPIARHLGEFPDYRLSTVTECLRIQETGQSHRAAFDAHAVRCLWTHAMRRQLHLRRPDLFRGLPIVEWLQRSRQMLQPQHDLAAR